ncbi:Heme A synthase [Candidatus Calditenuaceae archaeon HR02]|nr:Heme A synthase [Candidatus Calditenuaceae archaeon HR02]
MDAARRLFQSNIMAAAAVIIMNVIGSYVSAIGAGMVCPDWPLCPFPADYHVLIEFLHRVWALVVVATITLSVLRARRVNAVKELRVAKILVYTSLAVVMVQVGLGAIVIFTALLPELVALHQLLAQIILSLQMAAAGISWAATTKHIEKEQITAKS